MLIKLFGIAATIAVIAGLNMSGPLWDRTADRTSSYGAPNMRKLIVERLFEVRLEIATAQSGAERHP